MPLRKLLPLAAVTLAAFAATPSVASACGSQSLTQSFLKLSDTGLYMPVRNAGFESGTKDWKLKGATVVTGNEPWKIGGTTHTKSLRLATNGTALARQTCVTLDHTHSRFFARALSKTATLKVEIIWDDEGDDFVATALTLKGADYGAWKASPISPMAAIVSSLYNGEEDEEVALRFTAIGGSWDIDDVYVDPYRRR